MDENRNALQPEGTAEDPMQGHPLPTALLGFRKKDVLAAIDAMMKTNAARRQALDEQIAQLQAQMNDAQAEKHRVLEYAREVDAKLTEQTQTSERLEKEVTAAKKESEGFRAKLFDAEKNNYALRKEQNALQEQTRQLQEQMEELQKREEELLQERQNALRQTEELQSLNDEKDGLCSRIRELETMLERWQQREQEIEQQADLARQEAQRVVQQAQQEAARTTADARRDADKILVDANRAAVHLQEDAQQEAQACQRAAQAGAEKMNESIRDLQEQLAAVEKQMDDAYAALKAAAERIQKAAEDTLVRGEEVKNRAGRILLAQEDDPKPQQSAAERQEKPRPLRPAENKTHTLSDLVLEKLTRLLS